MGFSIIIAQKNYCSHERQPWEKIKAKPFPPLVMTSDDMNWGRKEVKRYFLMDGSSTQIHDWMSEDSTVTALI